MIPTRVILLIGLMLIGFATKGKAGGETLSGIPGAFAPADIGARASALAGAQTADPGASEALLYNPGALYDVNWSGGYTFSQSFGLINYNFLSGSYRLKALPLSVGACAVRNGDEIYSENEILLGAASAWRWFRGGITWKLRYASTGSGGEDFFDPESGKNTRVNGTGLGFVGFDFGLKGIFLNNKLKVGWILKDAFSAVSWNTENEAGTAKGKYVEFVPVSMKVGFSMSLTEDVELSFDIEPGLYNLPPPFDGKLLDIYSDVKNQLALGLELQPLFRTTSVEWIRRLITLRAGYSEVLFEKDKARIFAFGSGLAFPISFKGKPLPLVSIDGGYQINSIYEGHNSFRVGLSIQAQ